MSGPSPPSAPEARSAGVLRDQLQEIWKRTDRLFARLMVFQYLGGIIVALAISPRAWAGSVSTVHIHVWAAAILGFAISGFPVFLAMTLPGHRLTRHVIAAGQMLTGALLIHLSGGRIETHFHVFGSLAFLAFYRDWPVLITGTVVVALDHLLRGIFWSQSVYGVLAASSWRFVEHAGWVLFTDLFLILSVMQSLKEMRQIAERTAELESTKEAVERKVQERTAELSSSDERFRLAAAAVKSVIYEWDVATNRLSRVGGIASVFGCEPSEIEATLDAWERRVHPEDLPRVRALISARLREGSDFEVEYRLRDAAGGYRHIFDRGTIVRGQDGRALRIVGNMENVSQRKRDEAALRESREQYRSLVETVNAIPWEMDVAALRYTYVGPQAASLLGYPQETWLEEGFWPGRLSEEDRERVVRSCREAAARGEDHDLEFRLTAQDGRTVWVRHIAGVVSVEGGPVKLRGFLFDITERKRLEVDLRQAQKLEAVGHLAAGVAHEINTPIQFVGDSIHFLGDAFAGMRRLLAAYRKLRDAAAAGRADAALLAEVGAAEEAADVEYLDEQVPKAIERTLDGTARVAGIVRAMKEFAHPDRKEKAAADLNRALQSTLTVARNELKYVAEVETEFGDLPAVVCHLGDLNQVFLNLLVNAAHAIGEVVGDSGEKGRIRVTTRREGNAVVIEITDTGCGIPEAHLGKIFEPFFTTKEVGRGTGQGLAIARSIVVDKHGGRLSLESEVGRGTTFCITLPIGGEEAVRKEMVA